MIEASRRQQILAELDRMEREYGVRILHAIESGSRAWGFPSADSDYDVRIIYAHPRDWYLSVREGRDVIEQPVSDLLDIGGWELRKALRLMSAGNAVVHEWLTSPIVYRQDISAHAAIWELAVRAFDPRAAFHHYLAMAGKKLDVVDGEAVTAKRFLYGMRTLLCARWAMDEKSAPPMRFSELLDRYVPAGGPSRTEIDELVRAKAHGNEKDHGAGLGDLFFFAHGMLSQVRVLPLPSVVRIDEDEVDAVFRRLVT